jgi:anti-anti-sigma factor
MHTPAELDFAVTNRAGENGTTIVAVAGELDLYRIRALTQALQSASDTARVVLDLRKVTFLDSTTLALLVQEHRRLQEAGRELIVRVGEQTPTTAFTVTGIDRIVAIQYAGSGEEATSS